MARSADIKTGAALSRIADALSKLPNDAHLYYTINDDGCYLRVGKEAVHLGFTIETAVKNLREAAGRLIR